MRRVADDDDVFIFMAQGRLWAKSAKRRLFYESEIKRKAFEENKKGEVKHKAMKMTGVKGQVVKVRDKK